MEISQWVKWMIAYSMWLAFSLNSMYADSDRSQISPEVAWHLQIKITESLPPTTLWQDIQTRYLNHRRICSCAQRNGQPMPSFSRAHNLLVWNINLIHHCGHKSDRWWSSLWVVHSRSNADLINDFLTPSLLRPKLSSICWVTDPGFPTAPQMLIRNWTHHFLLQIWSLNYVLSNKAPVHLA